MAKLGNDINNSNFVTMLEVPQVSDINEENSFEYELELRQDLNKAIKEHKARTGEDRHTLSATLSRATGMNLNKSSLDCWTAPSRSEWRFPVQVLPAFIEATQAYWLLEKIAHKCGYVVMTAEEAEIVRLSKLEKMAKLLEKEINHSKQIVKGL